MIVYQMEIYYMRENADMGKLFYIMGKSASGKDTIYQKLLENQETIVKKFYSRVIDSFGKENLIHLLHQMKEMETVMTSEIEQMEEDGELED